MKEAAIYTEDPNYKKKRNTARLSIMTASFLAALKLMFAIISGSLVILASSIDSLLDIVASLFNYLSIKESSKPPDKQHPYGHGKIESLAAMFQSIIIFGSAVFIIYKGVLSIINETQITRLEEGIAVMTISTIISILLTRRLRKVGTELNSEVLKTDALHYATDIYQNIGVLITIVLIYLTGWDIFDPIIAFIIGAYIIKQVWVIFKKAFDTLIDHELPENIEKQIKKIIMENPNVKDFHNLRTRKSGRTQFIDFHMVLSPNITLLEANKIAHCVEDKIQEKFPNSEVLIHTDPYDDSHEDEKRQIKAYKG